MPFLAPANESGDGNVDGDRETLLNAAKVPVSLGFGSACGLITDGLGAPPAGTVSVCTSDDGLLSVPGRIVNALVVVLVELPPERGR